MNYENPSLLDRLAAEYVLGTMAGAARRRFDRLCDSSQQARITRRRWEDDLLDVSRRLEPIQPSAHVWLSIRRSIKTSSGSGTASPRRWTLAAAAGIAAIGLLVGVLTLQQSVISLPLATLGTDATHPTWQIERRKDLSELRISAIRPVELAANQSYELWALPRGGNPVSLGLLPRSGREIRSLTGVQRAALLVADKVAVSVEPAGGSPTGSPTGPIVIVTGVASPG
jgi:anti-sigma-K factor RskA